MWMGPNCPSCKNQEKEEDWEGNCNSKDCPKRDSDAPSKVPPDALPETPEPSEIQTGNIRWLISKSVENLQAVGSRDGKT